MADVFLSYARDDQSLAERLSTALERAGYSVWWDRNLAGGARYLNATEAELNAAKAVLVVWTKTSIASHWVADEAGAGRDTGRLVPITPDGSMPPLGFRQFQVIDFSRWSGAQEDAAFVGLLSALAPLSPAIPMRLSPTSTDVASMAAPQTSAVAIAVLPFVNMSSDPEQEYFSDGLSEELINQLAQIKRLRVAGRTSSFVFKGKTEGLCAIGQKLGVGYVLEGSVRKAGQRLRITAQLINCADGFHLWSERFDRELTDVFAIQDEIAHTVAAALSVTLGVGEATRPPGGTDNVEAYDKFLQARTFYHSSGPTDLLRAIEIYREALALDPRFAGAWYGLYAALKYKLVTVPQSSAKTRQEMEEASTQIVALAPDAWWTQAMRADQFLLQHRWSEAETAASAAVTAASGSEIDALAVHATFLMNVGRIQEAVDACERARELDPLSLRVSGFLQLFLDLSGRRDEAQAEFDRSRDLAGDHQRWEWAALLRLWSRKDADAAVVEAQFRAWLAGAGFSALHQFVANNLNRPATVRAGLRSVFDDPAAQNAGAMTAVFLIADHFGDQDLALDALRRSVVELSKSNLEGLWWPFESGVRADPRFKQIVRDIGLFDYWRTTGKWGDLVRPLGTDDFEVCG